MPAGLGRRCTFSHMEVSMALKFPSVCIHIWFLAHVKISRARCICEQKELCKVDKLMTLGTGVHDFANSDICTCSWWIKWRWRNCLRVPCSHADVQMAHRFPMAQWFKKMLWSSPHLYLLTVETTAAFLEVPTLPILCPSKILPPLLPLLLHYH